ncbi:hypothetical protein E1B28_010684 [Marasmius oreades]|uniref:Ubiquitin-like protease family profile domain-containing protein n=1 Tax=Marasmius oreades TaxID=181124 RepID=A0A9P7RZ50_9AGAR|nr:uncharacterized protein E1B28_010684 [Marasmius oreades]KAG7091663.1 hypothetical protein E1B28_010684 [Marasmius oreades]
MFLISSIQGSTQRDPIRRPLGPAVQWYDCLQAMVDREMTAIIERCRPKAESLRVTPEPTTTLSAHSREAPPSAEPSLSAQAPTTTLSNDKTNCSTVPTSNPSLDISRLSNGECASSLRRLCPCCFGGCTFGRSFDDGGDIHVALDGNLHHRQLASAGEGIAFYDSEYFLPKSYVDDVGERITAARRKPPKPRNPMVPDELIDQCRESYYAAKGESKHAASGIFRERGLMGLVCRHDVPLFVASIDTPGEQQKYAVALLERLFSLVPESATVVALYDIGCVLDRSRSTYGLLSEEHSSRLVLATSVLHAYGHQWPCQLKYNPRLRPGLGLTDGEGTERLWAALRKLIGPERQSSAARRKWLLDRALQHLAEDRRQELGSWMTSKLHNNVQLKVAEAEKTLAKLQIPLTELQAQWRQQQEAQTSVRSHAPLRLKRELGKVLQLQSEVDALEETINATKYAIKHLPFCSTSALATLPLLESAHSTLRARAEDLYLSLNISEEFPELKNIPFEYLQLLLLARDLKINIRKRCIGSFFEFDKLDRAVGGRDFALGTKAHQLTRKSISKRAPALQSAIKKYNEYCDKLKKLHQQAYVVPIPKPLPTNLAALRDPESSSLWEDVWIARSDDDVAPRWLVDKSVRSGIRAMLTLDRCREERSRLQLEADNMCHWYSQEMMGIKKALSSLQYMKYETLFTLILQEHLQLALRWANPFLALSRLIEDSQRIPTTPMVDTPGSFPPPSSPPSSDDNTLVGGDVDDLDLGEAFQSTLDVSMGDHYLMEVLDDASEGEEEEVSLGDPGVDGIGEDLQSTADVVDDREVVGAGENSMDGTKATKTLAVVTETSGDDAIRLRLVWEVPSDLPIDSNLLALIKTFPHWPVEGGQMSKRQVINRVSGFQHVFQADELARLDGSTQRLSGDCINGCSALLQDLLSRDLAACGTSLGTPHTAQRVAVFSTYLIQKIFDERGNAGLWRFSKVTKYWSAPIWILPLHDKDMEHWLLAVVEVQSHRVQLFDSLGSRSTWDSWLPKINHVVSRLIAAAREHGHPFSIPMSNWIAQPVTLQRLQSNGYDCGVWILYVMTAVLRGAMIPNTTEEEIATFRSLLARLIRYLPPYV